MFFLTVFVCYRLCAFVVVIAVVITDKFQIHVMYMIFSFPYHCGHIIYLKVNGHFST
jgi:hypothetical protein